MKTIYLTIITLLTVTAIALGQGNPTNLPKDSSNTVQTLQLPTSRNYIVTHTYLKPFSSHPSSLKTGDSAPVVEYFDGLGRPIQTVAVRASQLASDMVDRQDYDQAGNPEKQWLPYAKANNKGDYVNLNTFKTEQKYLLFNIYGSADSSKGFSITEYEKSPLNRVVKQGAPGAAWQLVKPVTYTYRTNTSSDNVQVWKYTGDNYTAYTYPVRSLFVTVTTDEDGKTVSEFKDKQGRLVMHLMGGSRTRYCYDEFGRLRCVVQPEGTSPASADFCFYYKYDNKGRLTDKRVPGSDWTIYIYDSRDRLVLSQDGNQRAKSPGEWSYTIYDNLNRPIEQGIWATTSVRATLVTAINNSLTYMVNAQNKVLLKNLYYDNYSGCPNSLYAPDATALGVSNYTNNTGRLTWEKNRLLNTEAGMTEWQLTAYYYDKYGRVIQAVSDNHLGGKDQITKKYNFTGQVIQTRHRHLADGITTYTDLYNDYDHRGRPVKERYQINGGSQLLMAGYSYDETGAKRVQYLHSEGTNGAFLQRNNYKYNIRGWLTEINNPSSFTDNSKFGLKLYYNSPPTGGTATYNGNISGMGWGTTSSSNANANMLYRFTYNNKNQLTKADFYKSGVTANGLDANYTYSHNGNLLTVNRFNKAGSYIDRITTQYTGNKINLIADLAGDIPNVTDYPGSTSQVGGFIYDQNGNLIQETNKLIYIDYNLFNLPKEVNYWAGNNRRINYYYNFDGAKLRKRVEDNGTLVKTDYCGPFVYETASGVRSLKYLITPYGRAIKNGSSWIYEYNLTDHLGNVRVVIRKGANNLAEVVQERHYYPFGMEMSELSYNFGSSTPNKYLYNGKELENDYGIYLYDYGARFYDPQLGRWHSVDPLAHKYYSFSPYSYCANNPIIYIDPDGRDIWEVNARGNVDWKEKSENHQLFFVNKKGVRGESITVQDRSILDQLSESRSDFNGRYAISNSIKETFNVFHFMANKTDVEWGLDGYRTTNNNEYMVRTSHSDESVTRSTMLNRYNEFNQIFTIHSHPGNATWEGTKGASIADQNSIINRYNRFMQAGMVQPEAWFKKDGQWTVFPKHYVYHKQNKILFSYTPWESSVFIRKTNKSSDLYRNLGF